MIFHGIAAWAALALAQVAAPASPVRTGPPPLELRVHVRNAAGEPLPGCAVRVGRRAAAPDPLELEARGIDPWLAFGPSCGEFATDARGDLCVAAPASGLGLELRAELPGLRARGAWQPGDALELELVARASHDVAIDVRDDDERPRADCGVALYLHLADGDLLRVASARSDARGRAVIADAEGRWLPGRRAFIGLDGVELPPVEFELERDALPLAAALELRARASPGLSVHCLTADGEPFTGLVQCSAALADADGAYAHWTRRWMRGPSFALERVPGETPLMLSLESPRAGSASVVLDALPNAADSGTLPGAPAIDAHDAKADEPHTPRRAELRLSNPTTSLGGILLAPDGRPLGDTWFRYALHLASIGDKRQTLRAQGLARTDGSGRLWLAIGASTTRMYGQLTLCAEPADAALPGAGLSVRVAREQGVVHLDLGALATRADERIAAGRVVADDGTPLAHATVAALDALPGDELRTTTDRDGRFELWGLARQPLVRCVARHVERVPSPEQRIELGRRELEFVLQPAARLHGRVRLPGAATARSWRVRAIQDGRVVAEAELGAGGSFELSGFPAGPTRLALGGDAWIGAGAPYGPYDAALEAPDDLVIDCSALLPLAFEIVDAAGAGASGAEIRGFAQHDQPFVPLADGRFDGWTSEPEASIDVRTPNGKLYAFHGVANGARLTLPTPPSR
jgi:hypothetical protein